MGLLKTININGQTIENAYHRIDTINGNKGTIKMSVNAYSSQQDFANGQGYLMQKFYNFNPSVLDDSKNFIKQGYENLKKLSEFEGATDVLEDGQTV